MLRDLWKTMRGPTLADLERMNALERQIARGLQFNAWMAVGFVLFVPAGLVLLGLAALKAVR